MSPKDREMMEQIFNEVEGNNLAEQEIVEMTEIEMQKLNYAMHLITSFEKEINDQIEQNTLFFLAPPNNFSYMVN